ncbi:MAG: hypothetical protein J7501_12835 [Bdellovibrio sp.]|nr:hypothetical protein [Bdellovibrio sp.]
MTPEKYDNTPQGLFRKYSNFITEMIQSEGLLFRPYSRTTLPYFSLLSEADQRAVLINLKNYAETCLAVNAQGHSLKETRYMVQECLRFNGFQMRPSDLELIEDDHVVEIYGGSEHQQLFRSFGFFLHSSYTLEDLYCRKWYHLYDRVADDQILVAEKVHDFLMQKDPAPLKLMLPEQKIVEKDTLERLECHSSFEYLLPVFKGAELAGFMTLLKTRIVT